MTTLRQAHGDSFFNSRVAKQAHDMVMAMEPDDAVQFALHVSYGLLQDDIAKNRRTLDRHVAEVSKRVLNGTAAAVRKGTLPREVFDEVSKQLEPVIKDWDESGVKRDRGGKFSTTESRIRTNRAVKPMNKGKERAENIPSAKKLAQGNAVGGHKMTAAERSAYQQQYLKLADTLDRYSAAGINTSNAFMVLRDKKTEREYHMPAITAGTIGGGWNASTHDLVAVQADASRGQRAANAGFDMVNGIADGADKTQRSGFAQQWNDPSRDTPGTNDRTYRRVKAGADLVTSLNRDPVTGAPISNKVAAASGLASLAGQYGPQAEQVLGPQARKTAYRYRGTERKPDSALLKQVDAAMKQEMPEAHMMTNQQKAMARAGRSPLSAEQQQNAAALGAQSYLLGRVPDPKLSDIQRKSGKIPPSEGVVISADGEVKHQSVGFADDHYLPFNLKNLKSLKGGQYVRTRTSGGLTTEDIYTGLVSGARSVTVVSNSGVFTVDFADDLRGGRRMSDKAASMVGQYGKTLDALKEGKIEREPLSAEVRAGILSDVQSEYQGLPVSREEIQGEYDRRVKAYRELPVLSERELAQIDAKVSSEYPEGGRGAQTMKLELQEAALETRQDRYYKLDGEGYAAAARALREQYPYFIGSVSYQTKQSRQGYNGEKGGPTALASRLNNRADAGYVKPRHNRPEQAQAGYYDKTINGQGKIAASETNYQNWENNPQRKSRPAAAPAAQEAKQEETKAPAQTKSPAEIRSAITARQGAQAVDRMAAKSFDRAFRGLAGVEGSEVITAALNDGIDVHMADPAKRDALVKEIRAVVKTNEGKNEPWVKDAKEGLAALDTVASGGEWKKEDLGRSPSEGYSFPGSAYSAGADQTVLDNEIKKVENSSRLSRDMDDEKLSAISSHAGQVVRAIEAGDQEAVERAVVSLTVDLGNTGSNLVMQSISRNPQAAIDQHTAMAEGAERLRALKKVIGSPTQKKTEPEPAMTNSDYSHDTNTQHARQAASSSSHSVAARLGEEFAQRANAWQRQGRLDPDTLTEMHGIAHFLKEGNVKRAREIADAGSVADFTEMGDLFDRFAELGD